MKNPSLAKNMSLKSVPKVSLAFLFASALLHSPAFLEPSEVRAEVQMQSVPRIIEFAPSNQTALPPKEMQFPSSENSENSRTALPFMSAREVQVLENRAGFSHGILPQQIVKSELQAFSPNIQRSHEPGILWKTAHFEVEPDSYWNQKNARLLQLVQTLEAIRCEADLTAELWRNPLLEQAGRDYRLGVNYANLFSKPGSPASSGQFLTSRASHYASPLQASHTEYRTRQPIRLRILNSGSSFDAKSKETLPCRLEVAGNEAVLTLEISSIEELRTEKMQHLIRSQIFRSTLFSGKEKEIFPIWLQVGLSEVFAGGTTPNQTLPLPETLAQFVNLTQQLGSKAAALPLKQGTFNSALADPAIQNLPQKERFQRKLIEEAAFQDDYFKYASSTWVRYFLTSSQGETFFPFWAQLGQIYRQGTQKINENPQANANLQKEAQIWLENFTYKQKTGARSESFAQWQKTSQTEIRTLWQTEVPILNLPLKEDQTFQKFALAENQKQIFEEMALLLKITHQFQKLNPSGNLTNQSVTPEGVRIYEFGKPREFQILNSSETEKTGKKDAEQGTNASQTPKEAEAETKVTAEDLQRLENIYSWFTTFPRDGRIPAAQDKNGNFISALLSPQQTEALFHPKDRAYLLQDYEGSTVLSAALEDGSTLHVILRKSNHEMSAGASNHSQFEIQILGIEVPEVPAEKK